MSGVSNNATSNILGFDYQKFIALERCLSGKENDVIWIECFGDVAHNGTSTEVKHHFSKTWLSDTHKDFWKTLYNLMSEDSVYANFTRFELLTTSDIKEESIFYKWNELSANVKVERLKKVIPTKTIKKYHDKLMSVCEKEMLPLIDKLNIISSQPNISEKLNHLKSHEALWLIRDEYRETFIEKMLGFITLKAIKNTNMWHIECNEFKREMIGFSMPYVQKDYPFPIINKKDINQKKPDGYCFVSELRNISLGDKIISDAIMDYLRSEKSLLKILKLHSSFVEHLDEFEDDLLQDLEIIKLKHSCNLSSNSLNVDLIKYSIMMYSDCQLLQLKQIRNIHSIEKYYQRGRIHSHVEQKKFSWLFEVEDHEAE